MIKQKLDDFITHNLIKGWLVIFMFENNSLLHLVQQKGVFAAQGSFAFVQSTFSFQQSILHAGSKAWAQIKTWHVFFYTYITPPSWNQSKEIFHIFKPQDLPNINFLKKEKCLYEQSVFLSLQMLMQTHINIHSSHFEKCSTEGSWRKSPACYLDLCTRKVFH